ncbi:MAG TPA: GGDEF domain-containing protein, partial [Bradyrhizobium sp.]|nr:GGDEF domain-containing protein [Bradyrhizobium sp.]
MLNVPTLWTAFVVNFVALGLIWAFVMRSYPSFEAAHFWTASAFAAALGASVAMLVILMDSLIPLLTGGTIVIFSGCLAAMGIQRFYDQPVSWRATSLITGLSFAGLAFFVFGYQSVTMRILVYSTGQIVPLALTLKLLMSREDGRINYGARLTGIIAMLIIAIYVLRVVTKIFQIGGDFSFVQFNTAQSIVILALMFLSMSWNFGFLVMAIDRLRNEVADLALVDDLTGVANRRLLMQRLTEECARSERSSEPFALLVIDLDSFKEINDNHGHAAGDACLQHFTLMTQTRLRAGDMLARTGGDEFCIVLPSSTLREAEMIARRIIEVCREDAAACTGNEVPIAVSIGVAQWTREVGAFPDRLIAAADHALYVAKKEGKNRSSVYDTAPPLAAEPAG